MAILRCLVAATALLVTMATPGMAQTVTQTTVVSNLINMTKPGGPTIDSSRVTAAVMGGPGIVDAVEDLLDYTCMFAEDNLFYRRLAKVETNDGQNPNTYLNNYYGGIWKVDAAMFRDSQANTPILQARYNAIRDAFGIDWMSVTWSDLRKPLYSAIAAALYLYEEGAIPMSPEQQGTYSQLNYHNYNSAFNFTRSSRDIAMCTGHPSVDVAFVLDPSVSPNDFQRMRDFVHDVLDGEVVSKTDLQAAVYQLVGNTVQKNHNMKPYTNAQQMRNDILSLQQAASSGVGVDIGDAIITVTHDAFSGSTRPHSTKMVILITDSASTSEQRMLAAGQEALRSGVTVVALGVGSGVNSRELGELVTQPSCRHYISVDSFRDLGFYTQLLQRIICREPMIATGIVQCAGNDCHNLAFPIATRTTTLVINTTCQDGTAYVTTRMPYPDENFADLTTSFQSSKVQYVGVDDPSRKFIYTSFQSRDVNPNCQTRFSVLNGITTGGQSTGQQPPVQQCTDWQYPGINPCLTPGRTVDRFPYSDDPGMFIQCDLRNEPYLTKCPPDEPFYNQNCQMCLGGPNSPSITVCGGQPTPTGQYCGNPTNPCTRTNILQGNFFFACPVDETQFLQCNIWGHAYIMNCPANEVWRENALTCEFENTAYNPCGTPGVRFYAYPQDRHFYIDCGADMVPNLMVCPGNEEWNDIYKTCGYGYLVQNTQAPIVYTYPHLTVAVTYPPRTTQPPSVYTVIPGTLNKLTTGFQAPCTRANVAANRLYFPYPPNSNQYIQCDLWGDAFLMSCQPTFSFDQYSDTCVNGGVIEDPFVG